MNRGTPAKRNPEVLSIDFIIKANPVISVDKEEPKKPKPPPIFPVKRPPDHKIIKTPTKKSAITKTTARKYKASPVIEEKVEEPSPDEVVADQEESTPAPVESTETNFKQEDSASSGARVKTHNVAPPPTSPEFIERKEPKYPLIARRKHKTGEVIVELVIEPDGKIAEAKVVQKAGWGFDESALRAALNSTIAPGYLDGKPVRSKVRVRYLFNLK